MSGQLGIDGEMQPERVCACGCGASLDGMRRGAKWVSRACATRWGRENPGRPLSDAYNHHRTHTRKRRTPSERGVQLSYYRTFKALTHLVDDSRELERALKSVLPARQLEILEQREGTAA
jgi:hypothetical protein